MKTILRESSTLPAPTNSKFKKLGQMCAVGLEGAIGQMRRLTLIDPTIRNVLLFTTFSASVFSANAATYNHFAAYGLPGNPYVEPAGTPCGSEGGLMSDTSYTSGALTSGRVVATACDAFAPGQFGAFTSATNFTDNYAQITTSGLFTGTSFTIDVTGLSVGAYGNTAATGTNYSHAIAGVALSIDGALMISASGRVIVSTNGGVEIFTDNYGSQSLTFSQTAGMHFAQLSFSGAPFFVSGLADGEHTYKFGIYSASTANFEDSTITCYGPDANGVEVPRPCGANSSVDAFGTAGGSVPAPSVVALLLLGLAAVQRLRIKR